MFIPSALTKQSWANRHTTTNILRQYSPSSLSLLVVPFIAHKHTSNLYVCVFVCVSFVKWNRCSPSSTIPNHLSISPCTATLDRTVNTLTQSHVCNTVERYSCKLLICRYSWKWNGCYSFLDDFVPLCRPLAKKENENQLSSFLSQLLIHGWNGMNTKYFVQRTKKHTN